MNLFLSMSGYSAEFLNSISNDIFNTLCSVWSESVTCRRGFQQLSEDPLARFKYVSKMAVACAVWSKRLSNRYEGVDTNVLSFIQTESQPKDLLFDASLYKSTKEVSVHREVRRILSLPVNLKTEKDLQVVVTALREISSFSEYPTPMQREMCKLGWYQRVEPNRVIIREGQRAYNFYFILSGTVVITEWNEVMKSSQTKCMLQRGMEFGEQAVFKKAYRSATVISRSTTELLCLDASDLASIYICGWDAPIRDPHIIHFLSTLYFLNNFPMELLQTNSQAIMFHHFRQGKVLVANSNVAQWIYIVKSGSLMVIKKLKDNKSFNSLQKFKEGEFNRFLEFAANQSFGKSSKYNFKANKLAKSNLPTQGGSVTGLPATINCKKYQASGATSNSTHRLSEDNSKKSTNDVKLPPLVERRKLDAPSPDADDSSFNHNITDEEADCNGYPTYIKISVLEKGQYFGLSSTVFENQPSVSLISNGADCLLLSKQFFFKHCSEKMLTQLKEKEFPYPTEEQLQMKLTAHLKWIRFKSQYYAENVQRVMNL